jgi:MFS family permease
VVASAYRELLTVPGARLFVLAGFFGRMPMAMMGIGIVLLVSSLTGSYGTAGAVAATHALAFAAAAPIAGRLADRHGQRRVLVPVSLGHAVAAGGLAACALTGAPYWTLFPAAVATGMTSPALGSMVRARWIHRLGEGRALHAAFSFESAADEVIFVTGPIVVTTLATAVHPVAGVTAASCLTVTGTLGLAAQVRTQPPARPRPHGGSGSAIAVPGLRLLVPVYLLLGSMFAAMDVIVVAFAQRNGHPGAAGPVLAAYASGSMVAALWYGGRDWRTPLERRFAIALCLVALGALPLPLIPGLVPLAAMVLVSGVTISPVLVSGFGLIRRLVPEHLRTEGLTWASTSIGVGIALGASVSGRIVDAYGTAAGFGAAATAAAVAALIGVAGQRFLRSPATAPDTAPEPAFGTTPATAPGAAPATAPHTAAAKPESAPESGIA